MITNIELTETGLEKFNEWFSGVARADVRIDAVMLEMLNIMQDRWNSGESRVYELGQRYSKTGRPELFRLDDVDVVVTEDSDV